MENLGLENFFPGDYSLERDAFASSLDFYTRPQIDILHPKGRRAKRRRVDVEPDDPPLDITDFDFAKPVYPEHHIITPIPTHNGRKLDIISILDQTHLVRFKGGTFEIVGDVENRLEGKYVMICCFYVPIYKWGSISTTIFELSLLSKELSSRTDFEMVLVVKMRPHWALDMDVFKHFVSAFSQSCLVVPFEHTARIDNICSSLGLEHAILGLLVGPDGVVIQDSIHNIIRCVGKDIFPFTDDKRRLYSQYSWRDHTLEEALECNVVYKNRPGTGPVSVSASELDKKKVVGLYLCGRGFDIPLFDRVYNECRAKGLDFEIVLVYTPYIIQSNTPQVLQEVIGSFLDKRNISWWVLPFSYFVSRRLFNLATHPLSDKLLILSRGKLVEADGELVIRCLGCDAYPFNRELIIQTTLEEVKRHTLVSLLAGGSLYRGNNPTHQIPVTALQRRNALLYLGSAGKSVELFEDIEKCYDDIKKKHVGFEVVFVNTDGTTSPAGEKRISSMPWLVLNPDPSISQSVVQAFTFWGREPGSNLVAFGEDGRICSLNAKHAVSYYGAEGYPFNDDLHGQLAYWLECRLEDFKKP